MFIVPPKVSDLGNFLSNFEWRFIWSNFLEKKVEKKTSNFKALENRNKLSAEPARKDEEDRPATSGPKKISNFNRRKS